MSEFPVTDALDSRCTEAVRIFMKSPSVEGLAELVRDVTHECLEECRQLERKLGFLPADWQKDSSLETWFPFTAEELNRLRAENERLRSRRCKYAEDVGMPEHCCAGTAAVSEKQPTREAAPCVVVPMEPTHEMLKALAGDPLLLAGSDEQELRLRYAAMIAAAPNGSEERALLEKIANANVIFPSMCANNSEAYRINEALAKYKTKRTHERPNRGTES